MKEYYIKEWIMRGLAILALTFATLWGCSTFQKTGPMPQMEVTQLTPPVEQVRDEPLTFIEALRKACLEDGHFTIHYQGEEERYECFQAPR